MKAPPYSPAPAPSPNLRANGEKPTHSPRALMRDAANLAADLGLAMSPCRIRRLVTAYLHSGRTDMDFRTWFLGYADPTGDTAVRNVMGRTP